MTEENKQEQPQEVKQEASPEAAKGKTPAKVEIPMNCGSCKKPIAKMRYYRNMQFFCNKKCWEKFKEKQIKDKEEAEQKAAA